MPGRVRPAAVVKVPVRVEALSGWPYVIGVATGVALPAATNWNPLITKCGAQFSAVGITGEKTVDFALAPGGVAIVVNAGM